MLRANGLGLRGHPKRRTGKGHGDRDVQFEYIQAHRRAFIGVCNPRISIDAKKRGWVENFKNPAAGGAGRRPT